jgi:preprotein translocase subunit YajC
MKTPVLLMIVLFLGVTLHVVNKREYKEENKRLKHRIEMLQGDSVIIRTFFIEQSQKHKDFYIDWVNYEQNKK